ncbi:MAG: DUF917 domain-containing protein [Anaerolineales bacterium]
MTEFTLTREDIEPLLEGLAILGTGGGGDPSWGRMIMENDLQRGREWRVVSLEDVPEEWTVVCGGIMGSVKALEHIGFENILENWESDFPLISVTEYMSKLIGKPIDAMIPFEAGGLNTPIVLTLASRMGIAAIDADALGRSAPETQMTSWHGHGVKITPMPLADSMGNIVVVSQASEPTYVDEVGRFVVTKGGYLGANNHHPMTGAQVKETSIPGTFSGALALGRAVMAARAAGGDPMAAVEDRLRPVHKYEVRLALLQEEQHMGFYFTTVGLELPDGRAGEMVIKNETMMLSVNNDVICTFPDRILMLEPGTGRGVMSMELETGMELVLLVVPAHPRLQAAAQTDQGRSSMAPARYGRPDLDYRPLAEAT